MIAFTLRETSQRGQSCIEWQDPGEPPRVMPHSLQVQTEIGVLWAASPMLLEAAEAALALFDGGPIRVSREHPGVIALLRESIAAAGGRVGR